MSNNRKDTRLLVSLSHPRLTSHHHHPLHSSTTPLARLYRPRALQARLRRRAPSPPLSPPSRRRPSRASLRRTYAPITRINHPWRFIRINLRSSRVQPVSSHPRGLVRHRAQSSTQSIDVSKTPSARRTRSRECVRAGRRPRIRLPARRRRAFSDVSTSTPASLDHGRRRRRRRLPVANRARNPSLTHSFITLSERIFHSLSSHHRSMSVNRSIDRCRPARSIDVG